MAEGGLVETSYTLDHPLIESLSLEIDLTYLDSDQRAGLLRDLDPFTKSGMGQ